MSVTYLSKMENYMMNNKIRAFTLSEVLIILSIIGIIAAITLSATISNYKEKVLVTQVKKTYSQMQNALKMYAAENNCSDISCISDLNGTTLEFNERLFKQYNGAKFCNTNSKEKICENISIKSNTPFNNGYGQTGAADGFLKPYFVNADGSAIRGVQYSSCIREEEYNVRDENGNYVDEDNDGNLDTKIITIDYCATIYIDANGTAKGPNQFGADIYRFNIVSTGKLSTITTQLNDVLTKNKLNYVPYNLGVNIKF